MSIYLLLVMGLFWAVFVLIAKRKLLTRKLVYGIFGGLVLSLSGCFGALYRLGAETSGIPNGASDINPLVFLILFAGGMLSLIAIAIILQLKKNDS